MCVRHVKIFAVKTAGLVRPGVVDQRQGLDKALPALFAWHVKALKMNRNLSPTHPEFQAAVTQHIDHGASSTVRSGCWSGSRATVRAETNTARVLSNDCGKDQRRGHDREGGVEVQLGQPGCVKAEPVGMLNLLQSLLIAGRRVLLGRARQLVEQTEFHTWGLLPVEVWALVSARGLRLHRLHIFNNPNHNRLATVADPQFVAGKGD